MTYRKNTYTQNRNRTETFRKSNHFLQKQMSNFKWLTYNPFYKLYQFIHVNSRLKIINQNKGPMLMATSIPILP